MSIDTDLLMHLQKLANITLKTEEIEKIKDKKQEERRKKETKKYIKKL